MMASAQPVVHRLLRRVGIGRSVGVATLILALALQAAVPALFQPLRIALFDSYMRHWPRQRLADPALVVTIDDASLARFGQWPWPRSLTAELVTRILAAKPAALGLDLLMPEPDRLSPSNWVHLGTDVPPELAERLAALPDNDAVLAKALQRQPVVLGVAGRRDGPGTNGPVAPVRASGNPAGILPSHTGLVRSIRPLDVAAQGHGLLSVDPDADGVVRRLPTLAMAGPRPVASLSIEMLRVAARAPAIDLALDSGGAHSVKVGPLQLPTQRDGSIWVDFSRSDPERLIPAADILDGKVPPERLDGRLVILGATALGLQDVASTPVGRMPGPEVHAQLLETLIAGRLAERPRWARWAELALTAALGLGLVLALPRRSMAIYAAAAAAAVAVLAGLGIGDWIAARQLIDVATPAAGTALVLVGLLAGDLVDSNGRRRQLRQALEQQRLHAARVAGELQAARRIQVGMLPRPEDQAPDPRYDLQAIMEPALEVGGDLYDFFKIDDDHLFVAIGDVSGKGVPACVFMALGKALYKSSVLRGQDDAGRLMSAANQDIARDNPEMLFITLFAGILQLSTGRLTYANAGHEPPILVAPGGGARALDADSGPPLCALDDFDYDTSVAQLQPGEILVLSTDGVSEAMNAADELMGRERMLASLAAMPHGATAVDAARALRDSVADFVADAPPSDDLTLVTVRWMGTYGAAPTPRGR